MTHAIRRILMTVDAVGGVWRYALDAARGLGQRGISVVLAGLGPEPTADQWAEARALPRADVVWLDAPLDWMTEDEASLDRLAPILARLVDEFCIDLVQVNVPSQAAGLDLPCPVVAVSHSCVVTWWEAVRKGPLPQTWLWQRERTRRGFDAADVVIAPSQSHADAVTAAYGPIERLRVIPNAVEPLEPMPKEPVIFAAGRWWDEGKNGETLDRAARLVRWPVVMAGAVVGPHGQSIAIGGAESLGPLPAADVRRRIASAAIVVCPSLYEPFGLVALEAASAGAALVLSDIPTFREVWNGAALFVDPHDPGAMAAALDGLAADGERRAELAMRAQVRARRFTLNATVDGLLAAYAVAGRGLPGTALAAE